MPHPVENIMRSTMEQLKEMVDVNTIVGTPIIMGDAAMVLPVSKVSLGFISGGGEYSMKSGAPVQKAGEDMDKAESRYPFAGTSIAGMSLTPIAFLSVSQGKTKLLPAQFDNTIDRAIEVIPEAISLIEKLIHDHFTGKKE